MMDHTAYGHATMTHADDEHFSTDVARLPEVTPTETVELQDGERFVLRISSVAKRIGDSTVRMRAYNGSIPGPALQSCQCSSGSGSCSSARIVYRLAGRWNRRSGNCRRSVPYEWPRTSRDPPAQFRGFRFSVMISPDSPSLKDEDAGVLNGGGPVDLVARGHQTGADTRLGLRPGGQWSRLQV